MGSARSEMINEEDQGVGNVRVDRYLSLALGISRSEAAQLIRRGLVTRGGMIVRAKDERAEGEISVQGSPVALKRHIHLMMNKPSGLLTAARDRHLPTVMDLIDDAHKKRGIAPVGRLDRDVTGLLLLTTHGELNHRLASPGRGIEKIYLAQVDGALREEDVEAFRRGLDLGDFTAKPAVLDILSPARARVTVTEGKFHQVKRMFEAVGKPVVSLSRQSVGGVCLDPALAPGGVRELTPAEASVLYERVGLDEKDGEP